jgi:tRNA dimethylallyltransferase
VQPSHLPLILIAGPTAVGKSDVALALAEKIGGEIISVDSMQVYRGLDIGTAKPTPAEQSRVPHHLIDVVGLTESFDAARFAELAKRAVADIQARRRVPILCGGTGLYFKAFRDGVGKAPPADPEVRARLEAMPLPELLRELEVLDPVTFARIDRKNPRRVLRAIEVIQLTGKPFSEQQARWNRDKTSAGAGCFFGLTRSSADLQARIDTRVYEMFAHGLVLETEHLLKLGLAANKTAMQAIGYRQVVAHLKGESSLADTIALVRQRTRQFAKRQLTWFRGQFQIEWVTLNAQDTAGMAADLLQQRWTKLGLKPAL